MFFTSKYVVSLKFAALFDRACNGFKYSFTLFLEKLPALRVITLFLQKLPALRIMVLKIFFEESMSIELRKETTKKELRSDKVSLPLSCARMSSASALDQESQSKLHQFKFDWPAPW